MMRLPTAIVLLSLLPAAGLSAAETEPGDPARGAELWAKCQACHTIAKGARHTVGPNLFGILGRKAATQPGYRYSPALAASGLVWSDEALDRFLAATQDTVPGSKMYGGLAIAQDRLDLIAWMRRAATE